MAAVFQTPKEDLNSRLGMNLKRAMLLRLARRDTELYPNDLVKRETVYNKYKVPNHELTQLLRTNFALISWREMNKMPVLSFLLFF